MVEFMCRLSVAVLQVPRSAVPGRVDNSEKSEAGNEATCPFFSLLLTCPFAVNAWIQNLPPSRLRRRCRNRLIARTPSTKHSESTDSPDSWSSARLSCSSERANWGGLGSRCRNGLHLRYAARRVFPSQRRSASISFSAMLSQMCQLIKAVTVTNWAPYIVVCGYGMVEPRGRVTMSRSDLSVSKNRLLSEECNCG
jgi:hypothetical protein